LPFDPTAIATYEFAGWVITDQAYCEQRERCLKPRQVDQHVVWAASIARGLAENASEAILGRINIDDLRAIDDPVTTGQDATTL
jgi:hypothetical protein